MSWEAGPRHAELIIDQLGLSEGGARSVSTPGVKQERAKDVDDDPKPEKYVQLEEDVDEKQHLAGTANAQIMAADDDTREADSDAKDITHAYGSGDTAATANDISSRRVQPASVCTGPGEARAQSIDLVMEISDAWTNY